MRLAIEKARAGIAHGQTPFGACIVKDGRLLVAGHNQVWATTDITAHAEIHVIRQACRILNTIDLSGCEIYSTCEPCPMCFSACHWARLSRVVYGAGIADARRAGFSELSISNQEMKQRGGSHLEIVSGVLQQECAALFDEWLARGDRRVY
ncbi:MAG TPA: nucleoside deaminase [Tepidisphaeraceae bacterium]|nr:nucleoside deaminase [Tepidisphaeraceae bacterium]